MNIRNSILWIVFCFKYAGYAFRRFFGVKDSMGFYWYVVFDKTSAKPIIYMRSDYYNQHWNKNEPT